VLRFLIAAREEVESTQLRDDLLSMLVAGGCGKVWGPGYVMEVGSSGCWQCHTMGAGGSWAGQAWMLHVPNAHVCMPSMYRRYLVEVRHSSALGHTAYVALLCLLQKCLISCTVSCYLT
jgi:hypothetical protein